MNWTLEKDQWKLSDPTRLYGDQLMGFVITYPDFPNVFDAFASSHRRNGKGHGPKELGRFEDLALAKAVVEQAVKTI